MINFIVRLYLLRTPLLMAALLTSLAGLRNSNMVSGLFAFEAWNAVGVGVLLGLLGGQIFILLRLHVCYGKLRFGGDGDPFPSKALRPSIVLAAIPGFANLAAIWDTCDTGVAIAALAGFAAGSVLAAIAIGYGSSSRSAEDPGIAPGPAKGTPRQPGWPDRIVKAVFGPEGFVDSSGLLYVGHYLAARIATVSFAVYVLQFVLLSFDVPPPAAIYSLILALSLMGWVLGVLCFALDSRRFPVYTALAAWGTFLTVLLPYNSHFYYAQKAGGKIELPPSTALFTGKSGPIIVVSAEGGGIWATAWTTKVLTELTKTFGADFACRIRLMSGVSGGSAGIMLYSSLYQRPQGCESADIAGFSDRIAAEGVAGDALDSAAQGLVLGDLLRPVYPFLGNTKSDRGYSLERAWAKMMARLEVPDPAISTVSKLAKGVSEGKMPLLAFNSTSVKSGWPVVFTNFELLHRNGLRSFHELYQGYDVPITTAVRASASFPYVSPSPRPIDCADFRWRLCFTLSPLKPPAALTDGGLFDNYGVNTAYEVLDQAGSGHGDAEILWIQIREKFACIDDVDEKYSWLSGGVLGPVESLYSVRSSLQRQRVVRLTASARSLHTKLKVLAVEFPDELEKPLSWALTGKQKEAIRLGWNGVSADAVTQVRAFLAR